MDLDFEDVLAGAAGGVIARSLGFAAAVWTGCMIGLAALTAGDLAGGAEFPRDFPHQLFLSPLLLGSIPGLLSMLFLLAALAYFVLNEKPGYRAWGIVAGVESLAVVAGWTGGTGWDTLQAVVAWLAWAGLLAELAVGLWLLRTFLGLVRARRIPPPGTEKVAETNGPDETKEPTEDQPRPSRGSPDIR